jgi:ATP-binding cassette, subfamily B, bacterial
MTPVLISLVSAGVMLYLNWQIGIVLIFYNAALTFINTLFVKPIKRISNDIQLNYSRLTSNILDALTGFNILKLFNVNSIVFDRFERINSGIVDLSIKRYKFEGVLSSTNFLLMIISKLGMIVVGAYLVRYRFTDVGTLLAMINMQNSLNWSLLSASEYLSIIQQELAGGDRVFEFLDEQVEKDQLSMKEDKKSTGKDVELLNINFKYKEEIDVLKEITLSIEKSKKIAIVGPSGGGKSTILKLLMSFYSPQSGEILIQGQPLRHYSLNELRDLIAYVPQNPYLFDGTIEFNIAIGNINAGRDEIEKAAAASYSHEFILKQPDGYRTNVGEKGVKLSGGQKQRICIARAIVKNAPILLLDEATSSLDSESEQEVQKAFENVMSNRTTIVVAHRLSTIQNSDWIYVVDKGRIIEEGRHLDLLKNNGLYNQLYKTQFK